MKLRNVALFILIFSLGALCTSLVYELGNIGQLQKPLSTGSNPILGIETLAAAAQGKSVSQPSPANHIQESQIQVYSDGIELDIPNATWSRFADTKSMEPVLDSQSNGLEIKPNSESDIHVGDIVSYQSTDGDIIIHRVIQIGTDDNGTYFIFKGDNNPIQDPDKVRFSQIKGILVGIIY